MISTGFGKDDDRAPCPKCKEYIEHAETIMESIDDIERRMNELKMFFSTHEWVLVENSENIKKLHDPSKDMDMNSLQEAYAQSVRFKRLVDSVSRSLDRIRSQCDDFGGIDENL
jgi:hypothetical protein